MPFNRGAPLAACTVWESHRQARTEKTSGRGFDETIRNKSALFGILQKQLRSVRDLHLSLHMNYIYFSAIYTESNI
jgi:hypothetical protein